jgi:hypothetical protein
LSAFAACEVVEKSFLQTYVKYLFAKNRSLKKGGSFLSQNASSIFSNRQNKTNFSGGKIRLRLVNGFYKFGEAFFFSERSYFCPPF